MFLLDQIYNVSLNIARFTLNWFLDVESIPILSKILDCIVWVFEINETYCQYYNATVMQGNSSFNLFFLQIEHSVLIIIT